jgi:hypothetical protein
VTLSQLVTHLQFLWYGSLNVTCLNRSMLASRCQLLHEHSSA